MPFEIKIALSEDKKTATIDMPCPLTVNANDLFAIMDGLVQTRAAMHPQMEPVDYKPGTPVLPHDAIRWSVWSQPDGRISLALLHPGCGWIGITLNAAGFQRLSQIGSLILHNPEQKQ